MKRTLTAINVCLLLLLTALTTQQANAQSVVAKGYTFSSSTQTYTYLSGGTTLHGVEVDDGYVTVPIGFPFTFCGNTYFDVTLCSNGWLRFGTGVGSAPANWNQNQTLSSGPYPALFPVYEDVSGAVGTSQYLVTGTAPNRIFKWECRDWLWDYDASAPCMSFQVWLNEATGIIEFHYKDEPGSVQVNTSGGATIGIASSSSDYNALTSVTTPAASITSYTFNLSNNPVSGSVYMWDPGPPCPRPVTPVLNNVNSTSADLSWTPATGAQGYEYFVDQNSTPPTTGTPTSTTGTTVNATGLTPASTYYLHVRTKCGTYNYSSWVTLLFNTLPPCVIAPPGITATRIDSNSADLYWPAVSTATDYEYFLKTDDTYPTTAVGATTTTSNFLVLTQLTSGTTYYIFLRVKCFGNDSSGWLLDSFYVPYPCRAPDVKFSNLNNDRVVTYWDRPVSSVEFEVLNTTTQQTPVVGIKMTNNSYHFPFLNSGTTYYVYARSYCTDRDVATVSKWSEATYKTWPLSVSSTGDIAYMQMYPNPAEGELWLTVSDDNFKGIVTIVDLTGKLVKQAEMSERLLKLDVSTFSSGVYTVIINDGSNKHYQKFTKL